MFKILLSILLILVTYQTTFARDHKSGERITITGVTNATSNDGEYNATRSIEISAEDSIKHAKMTCTATKDIEFNSETINLSDSTYTSPIITLIASSIILTKSDFNGVLSVDGDQITIKDCFIKALVIANYGKQAITIKITGKSTIEENIEFLGGTGIVKAESTVSIGNKIKNGTLSRIK